MPDATDEHPLFGLWDEADDWRLSRRSFALLGELMKRDDLPPLNWTVTKWSVVGEPDTVLSHAAKRHAVQAWADALNLRVREHQCQGYARLSAGGKRAAVNGEVGLSFFVDLYDDEAAR